MANQAGAAMGKLNHYVEASRLVALLGINQKAVDAYAKRHLQVENWQNPLLPKSVPPTG